MHNIPLTMNVNIQVKRRTYEHTPVVELNCHRKMLLLARRGLLLQSVDVVVLSHARMR